MEGALRVLIVEDNPAIARFLRRAVLAADAVALEPCLALDDLDAALERGRPHVVLMDLNMRGESALPSLVRLREAGFPVGCVTGYTPDVMRTPEDVPRLQKPVDPAEIASLLARLRAMLPSAPRHLHHADAQQAEGRASDPEQAS